MSDENPLTALHEAAGATLVRWEGREIPARFAGPAAEIAAARATAALFDLAHVGLAEISGEDCRRFSNGMFTNNLRALAAGRGNRNALADLKGRLDALCDVYCLSDDPDRFLVVLEGRDYNWLFERLDRYIIMDDVELEDLGVGASLLTLQGPAAAELLAAAGLVAPEADLVEAPGGVLVARRDRTGLGGFDLVVPAGALTSTWAALREAGAAAAGIEALEALRVRAGKPRYPADIGEKCFAHELLMRDELLAFDKGCYLGQEVINRLDTMGRLNKRLAGLRLAGAVDIAGVEVLHEGRGVGVVSSAASLDGETFGLAILRNPAIEAGAAVLKSPGGERAAAVSSPPFVDDA